MMKVIDFIFVALVYRDYRDLNDLCESLKTHVKGSYKVVVVDAFYDEDTSKRVKEQSEILECDYVQIENRGYGFGNNRGIEFANTHYEYNWLIICNPDTILKSPISADGLSEYKGIVAPDVIAKSGKHQNPYWAYENRLSEKLIYLGYNTGKKLYTYIGVGINRFLRDFFRLVNGITSGKVNDIYACHGSFLFIRSDFAQRYYYDEEMFLFYEEACLAAEARAHNISVKYSDGIKVFHKEDGSMNLANIVEYPHLKESYIHYYTRYRRK